MVISHLSFKVYYKQNQLIIDKPTCTYHIRDKQIIDSIFLGIGLIKFRFLKRPHNFDQKSRTYFHVTKSKQAGRFFSNFVAFSKYFHFKIVPYLSVAHSESGLIQIHFGKELLDCRFHFLVTGFFFVRMQIV